ncbi:hypothetical protein GCM10009582_19360 [Arthrobacter flavus]
MVGDLNDGKWNLGEMLCVVSNTAEQIKVVARFSERFDCPCETFRVLSAVLLGAVGPLGFFTVDQNYCDAQQGVKVKLYILAHLGSQFLSTAHQIGTAK